jgi:aspartyl-tRNA(Asn)/glutamyl-tRNA(Gln) amidotransferase subunit C
MALDIEQVRHVANLARLALSDEEIAVYQEQLSEILEYASSLAELDTEAIPPTAQVIALPGVTRDDCTTPSLAQEDALANASHVQDGLFVSLAILEQP